MSRLSKDPHLSQGIAVRFRRLIDDCLHLSNAELAQQLGLRSISSIVAMRKGQGTLDSDRLIRLAAIALSDGRRTNLHWLLTGEGPEFISPATPGADPAQSKLLEWLTPERIDALRRLSESPLSENLA